MSHHPLTGHGDGLEQELSMEIGDRIVEHRNRFARFFYDRMLETLPTLITYYNSDQTCVDWLKVEHALRSGFNVVIGRDKSSNTVMLGIVATDQTPTNVNTFIQMYEPLSYDSIIWTIPNHLRPEREGFTEITQYDGCTSGSFVVLRNKTLNYSDDLEIIKHYTAELAEIVVSRFSITMQAKIMTFLTGEQGDETLNKIIADLYNGKPYVKVDEFFDPENDIQQFNQTDVTSIIVELKREYQNKIGELNAMLGVNSLAVDKSSGVSDTEANSNRASTTAIANVYLEGRNNALRLYNKRYSLDIYAVYNDDMVSKNGILDQLLGEGGNKSENNNDFNGYASISDDTVGPTGMVQ